MIALNCFLIKGEYPSKLYEGLVTRVQVNQIITATDKAEALTMVRRAYPEIQIHTAEFIHQIQIKESHEK